MGKTEKLMLFLIALLCAYFNTNAEVEKDTIIIGAVNVYPPHEYVSDKGYPTGFSVELIQEIFSNSNIPSKIETVPLNNSYNLLKEKKIDILVNIAENNERKDLYSLSIPYFIDIKKFYFTKNLKFESVKDIVNKKIAVVSNTASESFLLDLKMKYTFTIIPCSDPENLISAIEKKQCDLGFVSHYSAQFYIKKKKISNIVHSNSNILVSKSCFACNKNNKKLTELINKNILVLKDQKYMEYLKNKWIKPIFEKNYSPALKYIVISIIIILLSIIILLIFNFILHRKIIQKTEKLNILLEKANKEKQKAEENSSLKSSFLANMSHEIRTPLNTICGFSSLIADEDVPKLEKQEYIRLIESSSNQLITIVSDIIDISKIEANQLEIHTKNFYLNNLIFDSYKRFEYEKKLRKKDKVKIRYNCSLYNPLSYISTDENRLNQILTNLLGNALKFTDKGEISFGYDLINENGNDFLKFYVKDSGLGISHEDHNLIFQQFKQTKSKYTHKGTGLGLYISKRLIEILGGRIWLESEIGKGSNFYFTIPYEQPISKLKIDDKNIIKHYNWNNKSILIVENNIHNKNFINSLLNPTGINKIAVDTGMDALNYFKENNSVNLVIINVKLPNIDELDMTQHIKKLKPKIPVIAVASYASVEDTEKVKQSSCDDFISKTVKGNEFYDIVNIWLNKN